VLHFVGTGTAA